MIRGIESLEAAIAAHLAEWDEPFVELAIHGTARADRIAQAIDAFCRRELGSPVASTLFYRSSVGAVAGVTLADRRRVAIKAHQPDEDAARLRDVVKLQNHLAANEGIAPAVLAGPTPLGAGLATVEEYCVRGATRDGHDPTVRKALASGLNRVMHACDRFVDVVGLRSTELPADSLWPTPHSRLFDFTATTLGAGYIDDLAREARRRMEPVGRKVITHDDWRAEHVRFDGDAISVAYDWDSLRVSCEPAAVGSTAHMFCADWSREGVRQAPALDEARAFIADYEVTRGHPFTRDERRACGSAFAFAVAYTARCGHAAGVDIRDLPGNHQHLVAAHGVGLLDL
jgi:hypothetical protein